MRRFGARWLPILLLCLLAVILMWPAARGNTFLPLDIVPHLHPWSFSYERVPVNNPRNSDIVQQVYPRRLIAESLLRQGAWPLWNPLILTGTPLLADGQLLFFYPPTLLFGLLPMARAFGAYALLQVILAALGSYLFARRLGLGRGAATISGVCYMFSGYLLTWLQFPHHSGAVAMLPWCFWAVARAADRRSLGGWLLAGVVLAMPLLTHIQVAFYAYSGAGCYLLLRLAGTPRWRTRFGIGAGFCIAVALACTLSAVQLVPQFALSAEGQRNEQEAAQGSAENQFVNLLRLALPLIGGQPRPATGWGADLLQTPQPYAGLAPLLLAGIALWRSRSATTALFALLAAIAFALALSTPLVPLLIALVPPYRQFADHTRWFVMWGFAVAVLAGIGAQALAQPDSEATQHERRWLLLNRLLLGCLLLFVAGWSLRHLALFTPGSRYGQYITIIRQQPVLPVLGFGAAAIIALLALRSRRLPRHGRWGVLVAVVAADLLWYGGGYNTSASTAIYRPTTDLLAALPDARAQLQSGDLLYPPSRQLAFLQAQPKPFRMLGGDYPTLLPNLASAYGIEDVRGYQSLYLARYNRLVRLIDGNDYTRVAGEGGASFRPYLTSAYQHQRLLDMLNVEYIIFPPGSDDPQRYHSLELVQRDDEGTIYRNTQVLPRAWLVHAVEVIPDDDRQLDRLARDDFDPERLAILPTAPPPLGAPSAEDQVGTLEYGPNRLRLEARAGTPALLIVSDAYTSDWRVEVDGQPATLYRANYALRGVWLPAGTHEISFQYRPRSFVIGGVVSILTLLFLIAYGWRAVVKARQPARRPADTQAIAS